MNTTQYLSMSKAAERRSTSNRSGAGVGRTDISAGDLEQLLLNLVTNARDAMPNGGMLSIRTEIVGDNIAILVHDTGCGMSSDVISRIQEPFFTTKKNGNGLGLSICRSIIWNARGRMEIASRPGAGTKIKVLLPIVRDNVTASAVFWTRAQMSFRIADNTDPQQHTFGNPA